MYQLYEALARERIRDQHEAAARRRLASQVASVRLWERLAAYAAGRAARSTHKVEQHAASEFSLAA